MEWGHRDLNAGQKTPSLLGWPGYPMAPLLYGSSISLIIGKYRRFGSGFRLLIFLCRAGFERISGRAGIGQVMEALHGGWVQTCKL
jgi:hypothetical protein